MSKIPILLESPIEFDDKRYRDALKPKSTQLSCLETLSACHTDKSFPVSYFSFLPSGYPTSNSSDSDLNMQASCAAILPKDHEKLINVIDDLREHIGRHIDLPQLVVCGDQSSGKSSVLEAISGLPFPMKSILCTRFATELALRRQNETCLTVTIKPGPDRSEDEALVLRQFNRTLADARDFSAVMEDASRAMGLSQGEADGSTEKKANKRKKSPPNTNSNRKISTDILHVEITGLKQPNLTLVDLPGIIRSQANQSDIAATINLTHDYMKKTRTIILAVLSASHDFATQGITNDARLFDDSGERTLGIITKPDTLPKGSELEHACMQTVIGKDAHFPLGWHVLKNRDFTSRDFSSVERDQAEYVFFLQGIWATVKSRDQLGVGELRLKLSEILKKQILAQLPDLILEAEALQRNLGESVAKLGWPKEPGMGKYKQLMAISDRSSALLNLAIKGQYGDPFFRSLGKTTRSKPIRASVDRILAEVRTTVQAGRDSKTNRGEDLDMDGPNDDRQVAGNIDLQNIVSTFLEQSRGWKMLIDKAVEALLVETSEALELILGNDRNVQSRVELMVTVVDPTMVTLSVALKAKVGDVIDSYQNSERIVFEDKFLDCIRESRCESRRAAYRTTLSEHLKLGPNSTKNAIPTKDVETLLDKLADEPLDALTESANCAQAWYQVRPAPSVPPSLLSSHIIPLYSETFCTFEANRYAQLATGLMPDDVGTAVENWLKSDLHGIFANAVFDTLDAAAVERIVGATPADQKLRNDLARRLGALDKGIAELKAFQKQYLRVSGPRRLR